MYLRNCLALLLALAGCSGAERTNPDLGAAADLTMPGAADLTMPKGDAASTLKVVINELNPNGPDELTDPDWVELMNLGPATADLTGYSVRDDKMADLTPLPQGTTIPPGGYLIILCDDVPDGGAMNAIHVPFKLSGGNGDEFHLVAPDSSDVDTTMFAANAVANGQGWGRLPDGTGAFAVTTLTRGTANMK